MHANEVVASIATPRRGSERGRLPCAGLGQCAAWRPGVHPGSEPAAIHASISETLTQFPGR